MLALCAANAPLTVNAAPTRTDSRPRRTALPSSDTQRHLSCEQLTYLSSWRAKINPRGRRLTVLNGAIGADISTPLLATDATRIEGIDLYKWDVGRLQHYLKHWDRVDWDVRTLQPPDPRNILGKRYQQQLPLSPELLDRDFAMTRAVRKIRGYWDNNLLSPWSHERLLVYEMKSLGVDRDSVRVSTPRDGRLRISFYWGDRSLGIRRRRRVLDLRQEDIESFFARDPGRYRSRYDVYLQKSIPVTEIYDESVLHKAPEWLRRDGMILYTATGFHTPVEEEARARGLCEATGAALVRGNAAHERTLTEYVLRENSKLIGKDPYEKNHPWFYGWKIFGLQR